MVKTTQPSDIDPDSSSEICAKSVQGGISAQRSEQIVAWNALADAMIKVVRTIKKNEQHLEKMTQHIRLVALVVIAAVVCGMLGGAYVARSVLVQRMVNTGAVGSKTITGRTAVQIGKPVVCHQAEKMATIPEASATADRKGDQ